MKATQILMDEHVVISSVLDTLQTAARSLEQGAAVRPGFFLDAADFIRGFADGCHHKKEEGVLFKSMAASGVPVNGGPIGVMLSDHEQGRIFTSQMRAAAERLQSGDTSAVQEVVANANGYVDLLRAHIFKENNILFPMADRVIPLAEQDQVSDGFEMVEHEETGEGVHEKFLAMAQALAAEAGSLKIQA